jgi:hypothetical protein
MHQVPVDQLGCRNLLPGAIATDLGVDRQPVSQRDKLNGNGHYLFDFRK